MTTQCSRTNK